LFDNQLLISAGTKNTNRSHKANDMKIWISDGVLMVIRAQR